MNNILNMSQKIDSAEIEISRWMSGNLTRTEYEIVHSLAIRGNCN